MNRGVDAVIKRIIKLDGAIEDFVPHKLNQWGEWAIDTLGDRIDWSTVVINAVGSLPEEVTSQRLQEQLIEMCLQEGGWPYKLMAGRLFAVWLSKKIFPEGQPTVLELHKKLRDLGYMEDMGYSDEEYSAIEEIIDHELDLHCAHHGLKQIREKYAIRNKITGEEYETQQYVYMRMAMKLAELEKPGEERLSRVNDIYGDLSGKNLNAPTPNYVNLGTKLRGYASCCIYKANDNGPSLAIGDFIANTMTLQSAGIGSYLETRSLGDPIRGGLIKHLGKNAYLTSNIGSIKANMQNGRAGAGTTYYNCYDPDAPDIVKLKNPLTPQDKRIPGIDYAFNSNRFFAEKSARKEKVFSFNCYTAPDLQEALFSGDKELFRSIYEKYEEDDSFPKNYVDARKLTLDVMSEGQETGRHFLFFSDEANHHTPFKEPIHSSNLCVAPETKLLTDKGNIPIKDLVGKTVPVWNGEEYSPSYVAQTNWDVKLIKVKTSDGKEVDCTPYHKFYVLDKDDNTVEVRAIDLKRGQRLIPFKLPGSDEAINLTVKSVKDEGRRDNTYCLNEPRRHLAVFNGILTGQCTEVMEPTAGYDNMMDLYLEEDHGRGEVALCSLAAINVGQNLSDEKYYKVMYNALYMINRCIHLSDYPLPHVGFTAKARMNAGVGMIGVAEWMARNNYSYASPEGKKALHELAERHMYFAIKASLELSKIFGNAPWMHKTKWPDGWMPIDTYNKGIDDVVAPVYKYDWEDLRKRVVENGGIANSCLVAHMPTESSSKAIPTTNSLFPIRDYNLLKSDNNVNIDWSAPDEDILRDRYEIAYDIPATDLIDVYGIVQKFTDQGISADIYRKIIGDNKVNSSELLNEYYHMVKRGLKSRYYNVTLTSSKKESGEEVKESNEQVSVCQLNGDGCM